MTEASEYVRQKLDALPDIELPDAVWQRIDVYRKKQQRRRKVVAGIVTFVVVSLLAAAPALRIITSDPASSSLAATSLPKPDNVSTPQDVQAEIRALDQALQAAYARSASDAEIAPMWLVRDALVASIKSGESPAHNQKI